VQNHDQVGNRAAGDRLNTIVPFEAVKLAAGLMFAAPAIPLLFMGEEYGETAPFQFFTSFLDRGLAEAVKQGRTGEFSRFGWKGTIPDPGAPATFVRSRLSHSLASAPRHRELREYYRHWLALRRLHPALGSQHKERATCTIDGEGVLVLTRGAPSGAGVRVVANLTAHKQNAPAGGGRVVLDSEDPRFGGRIQRPLAPYQLLVYDETV
jgi:maltooligosyltrehalose trehalohydrolase